MPRRRLLLGLLFSWMVLLTSPASISTAQTDRIHQLDQEVLGLLRSYDVPGTALASVEDGEVVWEQGYGMADVTARKPVRSDTVFQAASISKAVSAWGVMRLVEQGKRHEELLSGIGGGWAISLPTRVAPGWSNTRATTSDGRHGPFSNRRPAQALSY